MVSSDGRTVVSNEVIRKAFNSKVNFDYSTANANEKSAALSYLFQFIITVISTIIIEGIILLIFGFNLKLNLKPFLVINLITQVLLTTGIILAMKSNGTFFATFVYILAEISIFIIESVLFSIFLRQHSKLRRVFYALAANWVSFIAGIIAFLPGLFQ